MRATPASRAMDTRTQRSTPPSPASAASSPPASPTCLACGSPSRRPSRWSTSAGTAWSWRRPSGEPRQSGVSSSWRATACLWSRWPRRWIPRVRRRRGQRQGEALLVWAGKGGEVSGGQLGRHALPPHGPWPARCRRPAGKLPVSAPTTSTSPQQSFLLACRITL